MCTNRERRDNLAGLQCLATVTMMDMAFKAMTPHAPRVARDWEPGPPPEPGWYWCLGPLGWFIAELDWDGDAPDRVLDWADGQHVHWDVDAIRGHQGPLTPPVGE